MCGGTGSGQAEAAVKAGLSPRVRGNHSASPRQTRRRRSIPACAGEPRRKLSRVASHTVYPRVCGGTPLIRPFRHRDGGLSPRVRGNLLLPIAPPASLRSIPACAGEPSRSPLAARRARVYPRVCGGTERVFFLAMRANGLSPRVRGNLLLSASRTVPIGSIPACAGEPKESPHAPIVPTVYPRVCGGTSAALPSTRRH